jgi:hypothetical protein
MVKLENLKWSPKWVSHLGCVKGCLNFLGIAMTDAWLYGGTGHAFVINVHEELCPSGPTAWRTMMLFDGGINLGYEFDMVFGWRGGDTDFSKLQADSWEFIKTSIDQGSPVYAWELEIPEFYVVYGYDEVGYYYSGPGADDGKGPKPWGELGDTGIGMIEVYRVKPGEPKQDAEVVKSAFGNALKHASNPDEWIFEKYRSGVEGYDNWINALASGVTSRFGMGYNTAVWHECRKFAVAFLKEAKERLGGTAGDLFDEAIKHYGIVADRLGSLSESYPFIHGDDSGVIPVDDQCQEAIGWLKEAREAETEGLKLLDKIQAAL